MPSMYKDKNGLWTKQCSNCKADYIVDVATEDEAYNHFRKNFSPRRTARDGLESGCYRCRAIAEMRIRFGIDVEAMIDAQNGVCAICSREIEFNTGCNTVSACVDHDHVTNEIRGILCRHCNLGLGHFRDNEILMQKAITYLKTWKDEHRQQKNETIGRDK